MPVQKGLPACVYDDSSTVYKLNEIFSLKHLILAVTFLF